VSRVEGILRWKGFVEKVGFERGMKGIGIVGFNVPLDTI